MIRDRYQVNKESLNQDEEKNKELMIFLKGSRTVLWNIEKYKIYCDAYIKQILEEHWRPLLLWAQIINHTNNKLEMFVIMLMTLGLNSQLTFKQVVTTCRIVTLGLHFLGFGQSLPSIWDGLGEERMEKRGYFEKFWQNSFFFLDSIVNRTTPTANHHPS
jgi:hypothetical protein